jgi:hypothetical protein
VRARSLTAISSPAARRAASRAVTIGPHTGFRSTR